MLDNAISIPKTMAISVDLYYDIIERTGFKSLLETQIDSTNFQDVAARNDFVDKMFQEFPTVKDLETKCPDLLQSLVEF